MFKKLTKILLILLTVFTVYFIKIKDVTALGLNEGYMIGDPLDYTYISPINPMDANGNPKSKTLTVFYKTKDDPAETQALIGSYPEYFVMNTRISCVYNDPNKCKANSNISGSIGFGYNYMNPVKKAKNVANVSFSEILSGYVSNLSVNPKKFIKGAVRNYEDALFGGGYEGIELDHVISKTNLVSLVGKEITSKQTTSSDERIAKGNADYVKYENGIFSIATEDEYKKYIKNQSKYTLDTYQLSGSGVYAYKDASIKEFIGQVISEVIEDKKTYLTDHAGGDFLSTSKIVFVSTKRKQLYEGENMNILIKNMQKYKENDTQYENALKGLNIFIDPGKYDTRSFSDVYYKTTKDTMIDFMIDYMNENKSLPHIESVSKNNFTNWFDLCGRYLLEDGDNGVSLFKKVFQFIFADPNSEKDANGDYTLPRTDNPDNPWSITFEPEEYSLIIKSINDMIKVVKNDKIITKLVNDVCYVYCPICLDSDGDACTRCTRELTEETDKEAYCRDSCSNVQSTANETCYNTCLSDVHKGSYYSTCRTCKNRCKDVQGAAYDTCFDTCLNEKIGDGAADYFHNSYNSIKTTLEKENKEATKDLLNNLNDLYETFIEKLKKAYAPEPNFHFGPYIADCDDIKVVHIIYKFLIYLAPALVILLGALDYTKAMLNSDEKKQQKFKKDFKKRIILLVLLILVPIIISGILDLYNSATDSSLEHNLMYCIVKGSK